MLLGGVCVGAPVILGACASTAPPPATVAKTVLPSNVLPIAAQSLGRELPLGWEPYVLRADKRATRYKVVTKDERVALHARAEKSATGANCDVKIDPNTTPWLSWSWRTDALVADATVADGDADDCAVRIVVGFDGDINELSYKDLTFYEQVKLFTGKDLPFASIMYVWDPKLARDAIVSNFRTDRIRYLVAESGTARLGQWTSYRRNVVDDYKRAFGSTPKGIFSIGVLSDTDDLGATAEAWYGSISVSAT
jgi:hypothetical protein